MKEIETLAIKAALSNTIQKLPRMAAVLITPEGDIFVGRNQYKTHPLQATWAKNPQSIFLHAEIDCILKAFREYPTTEFREIRNFFRGGSSIFIARVLKNGLPALAKPCSGCFGALLHFGITDIKWTT